MRRTFCRRILSLLLTVCVLTGLFCIPASANSGPRRWEGLTHSGATFTDENCPIEATHEKLTLTVTDEPVPESTDASFWADYANEVTAEYTFYNPTQDTITATLSFPCGSLPNYALERTEKLAPEDLIAYHEKYGAYVNGEKIGTTARYSLNYRNLSDGFDAAKQFAELQDEPVADDLLTPETPVTVLLYEVGGIDRQPDDYFTGAELKIGGEEKRFVYLSDIDGERWCDFLGFSSEDCYVYRVENGDRLLAVIFGEPPAQEPTWAFRESGGDEPLAAGEATLVSEESFTFREFCERQKAVYPDASYTDLFNASVRMIGTPNLDYTLDLDYEKTGAAPVPDLMGWYEYEITLAPGETLTNTVRAPLYPEIYDGSRPRKYEYTYLLSPAAGWAKFGTLEIGIDTPFYLSGESLEGFKKTENGYTLTREGLPEEELTFTLCKSRIPLPSPEELPWLLFPLLGFGIPIAMIVVIVVSVVRIIKIYQKRKREEESVPQ